jgi:polar amino acid transport system substrate-binding protein
MRLLLLFSLSCVGMLFGLPAKAVEVLAVEYPPFTSHREQDGGLAFQILRSAYPQITFKPLFLPPKRAYTQIKSGNWCLSFYPAPQGVVAESIALSKNQLVIGLVRLQQQTSFRWSSLDELHGQTVAMLRTGEDSAFSQQFSSGGLQVVYAETVRQALELVLRGRADLAMFDSFNFARLAPAEKARLQFSENQLVQTPIRLFSNPHCTEQLPPPATLAEF